MEEEIQCPNFCQVCGTKWEGLWTGCKCNPQSLHEKANRLRERAENLAAKTSISDTTFDCKPIGSYFEDSKNEHPKVKYTKDKP